MLRPLARRRRRTSYLTSSKPITKRGWRIRIAESRINRRVQASCQPKILRAVKKVARKTPGGRFKKIRKEIALISFFLQEDEFGFPNYKFWYDCKSQDR